MNEISTFEDLVSAAKLRAGKSEDNLLDQDLEREIEFAFDDLRRIGVAESYLTAPYTDGNITACVFARVKAYYCMDEYFDKWEACYKDSIIKIKGHSKYFVSDSDTDSAG